MSWHPWKINISFANWSTNFVAVQKITRALNGSFWLFNSIVHSLIKLQFLFNCDVDDRYSCMRYCIGLCHWKTSNTQCAQKSFNLLKRKLKLIGHYILKGLFTPNHKMRNIELASQSVISLIPCEILLSKVIFLYIVSKWKDNISFPSLPYSFPFFISYK